MKQKRLSGVISVSLASLIFLLLYVPLLNAEPSGEKALKIPPAAMEKQSRIAQAPSFVCSWTYITVPEAGTGIFRLWLSAQPSADVTVSITRTSGDADLTVSSGATFTIPKGNWNTPVTITIAAGYDLDDSDGTATFEIKETSANGIASTNVVARELDIDGIINVGGTITQDTTWSNTSHDYHITSAITIPAGVHLYITPGVTVVQDSWDFRAFTVSGSIRTSDTLLLLKTFTDTYGGDWPGQRNNAIYLLDGSEGFFKKCTIRTVEGCNNSPEYYDDWSAIIEAQNGSHLTIQGCQLETISAVDPNWRTVYGIVNRSGATMTIDNDGATKTSFTGFRTGLCWEFGTVSQQVALCDFIGCENNVRLLGDISQTITLNNAGMLMVGDVNIQNTGQLILTSGSSFQNPGYKWNVSGKLQAVGSTITADTYTDTYGGDYPSQRTHGIYVLDGGEVTFQTCALRSSEKRGDSATDYYDDWSALIYTEGASKLTIEGCSLESLNDVNPNYKTVFGILIGSATDATIKEYSATQTSFKGFRTGINWTFGAGTTQIADGCTYGDCEWPVRMAGDVSHELRMPVTRAAAVALPSATSVNIVTIKNGGKLVLPAGSYYQSTDSVDWRLTIEAGGELNCNGAELRMGHTTFVSGKIDARSTTMTLTTRTDSYGGDYPDQRRNGIHLQDSGIGTFQNCVFRSIEINNDAATDYYDDWAAIINTENTSQLTVEGCSFESLNTVNGLHTVFGIRLTGGVLATVKDYVTGGKTIQNSFKSFRSGIEWEFGAAVQEIALCQFTDCDYNVRLVGDVSQSLTLNNTRQYLATPITIQTDGQLTLPLGSELISPSSFRITVNGTLQATEATFRLNTWTDAYGGDYPDQRYNGMDIKDGGEGIFQRCVFTSTENRSDSATDYYDDWSATINTEGASTLTVEGCSFESLNNINSNWRTVFGIRLTGDVDGKIIASGATPTSFKGFRTGLELELGTASPLITNPVIENCDISVRMLGNASGNITLPPNLNIILGGILTVADKGKLVLNDTILNSDYPINVAGTFQATNSTLWLRTRRDNGDWNWRNGMYLSGTGTANLNSCSILGTEYSNSNQENCIISSAGTSSLTMDGCLLANSYMTSYYPYYALYWNSTGALNITNSAITNNATGIYVNGSFPTTHLIQNNDFHGNFNWAIYNNVLTVLIARNNWWGSPTGPTNARNPGGAGDKVSDSVDFGDYLLKSSRTTTIFKNPATGQEGNNLTTAATQQNVELIGFRVEPASSNVTQVAFRLFNKNDGLSWDDISNFRLVLDANGNGTIDPQETQTVGGSPVTVAEGNDLIVKFSQQFTSAANSTAGYILLADFINLEAGDNFSIELSTKYLNGTPGLAVEDQTTAAYHFAGESVVLSDPAYGQLPDNLNGLSNQTRVSLFAFSLKGSTKNVTDIKFILSGINGINASNMSSVKLMQDLNNNGIAENWEPPVGGTPTVTFDTGGATGSIEFKTEFAQNAAFILVASFNNLLSGYGLTVNLNTADVKIVDAVTVIGAVTPATHSVDSPYILAESNYWYPAKSFGESGSEDDFPILGFILFPGGRPVTTIRLKVSGMMGIAAGDISDPKLYWDKNSDGVVDAGDELEDSGVVNIKGGAGYIEFKGGFDTRADLIATADFKNLDEFDELTISIEAGDVKIPAGNLVLGSGPSVRHVVKTATPDNVGRRQNWTLVYRSPGGTSVNGRFNHAGDRVILGYNMGSAWIYDTESNTPLVMLKEHYDSVEYAGFNSDDSAAVTVTRDGAVYIWDIQTGAQRSVMFSDLLVTTAYPSPDFSKLTVITEGKAKLLDLDLKKELWEYVPGNATVNAIAYSPDGKYVAVGQSNKYAYLLDANTGVTVGAPFIGHSQAVTAVSFTGDGSKMITSSTDAVIQLWDIAEHTAVTISLQGQVSQGAAVSKDGKRVAMVTGSGNDAQLRMFNELGLELYSKNISTTSGGRWGGTLENLTFDDQGTRVLITSSTSWAPVACFNVDNGSFYGYWGPEGYFPDGWFDMRPRIAQDGKRIFYTTDWGLDLLNRDVGKTILHSPNYPSGKGYDISADGSKIIWFADNQHLRVDNVSDSGFVPLVDYYTGIKYNAISASHSGGMVIAGDRLLSALTGRVLANYAFPDNEYRSAFSPDSRLWGFARADNKAIITMKTNDPHANLYNMMLTDPYTPYKMFYHPDGVRVACVDNSYSSQDEQGVQMYDMSTALPVGLYRFKNNTDACLSNDGTMMLIGGENTVRLYDVRTGRILRYFFPQHSSLQSVRVRSVAFANNDSVIMIAWSTNYIEVFERTKAASIEMTPVARTLAPGEEQAFTIEVVYDDTTREDITPTAEETEGKALLKVIPPEQATFNGNILTLSPSASGAFIVQARYRVNNQTFTAETLITVGKSVVVELTANPKKMTVTPGVFRNIRYTATYDDGYESDVTDQVTLTADRLEDVVITGQSVKVLFTANPGDIIVQGAFIDRYDNIRTANTTMTTFGPRTAWERYQVTSGGYGTAGDFRSDGKKLAVGSSSGAVSIYNVGATPSQYELENVFTAHEGQVLFLGYTATNRILTASDEGTIKIWDMDNITTTPLSIFYHSAPISAAILNSNKTKLVIGDTLGGVGLFDIAGGTMDWLIPQIHESKVNTVAIDNDYVLSGGEDKRVKVLAIANGSVQKSILTHTKPIVGVGFMSANSFFSVSQDKTATFWRKSDFEVIDRYEFNSVPTLSAFIGGQLYIAMDSPVCTYIYNSDGLLLRWLEHPPSEGKIAKYLIDPSGNYIITGRSQTTKMVESMFGESEKSSTFSSFQFWETNRGIFRGSLAHSFPLTDAHATADATKIFTQDSKRTMVWNFAPDPAKQTFKRLMETGYFIAPSFAGMDFTADDGILATRVGISIYTYKPVEDILWKTVHFPGPGAGPFAISPDGSRMAMADVKTRLWDMISMTQIREETRLVNALDFRLNDNFLGSIYADEFVGVWDQNGYLFNGILTTWNPIKIFINSTGQRASVVTEHVVEGMFGEKIINYYLEIYDISNLSKEPPLVNQVFLLSVKQDMFGEGEEIPQFCIGVSDDTALALVGASGNRPVKLINVNDGSIIREFNPPSKKNSQNAGAAAVGFTDNDDSVMLAWSEGFAELHRRVRPVALAVALDLTRRLRGDYPDKAAINLAEEQERQGIEVHPGDTFRANSTTTFSDGQTMNVTASVSIVADKPDLVTINGSLITVRPDAPQTSVNLTITYEEPKFKLEKQLTINIGALVVNANIVKYYILGEVDLKADEKTEADANNDQRIDVADLITLLLKKSGKY